MYGTLSPLRCGADFFLIRLLSRKSFITTNNAYRDYPLTSGISDFEINSILYNIYADEKWHEILIFSETKQSLDSKLKDKIGQA